MNGQPPRPVSSKIVAPDPSIASAIGRHHTLETAVADLVDNSIDAGAGHVLVRLLMEGPRPVGLQVIDDGSGMDSTDVERAMTYAHRRDYEGHDLGHFGIGLKAASLSQAKTLLVWSRAYGAPAVGRRLRRDSIDTGPLVEEFSTTDATAAMAAVEAGFPLTSGTVVEWQEVQTFLTSSDAEDQSRWVSVTVQRLLDHLGLVFHRLLSRGAVSLEIDLFDVELGAAGAVRTARPVDPFGYTGGTQPGFPKVLPFTVEDFTARAVLHVWPHRDRSAGFGQSGRSEVESQGFYVYRNDRLLQTGGWNALAAAHTDLGFARVELDVDRALESHVTINPEKAGTTFDDELRYALARATATDGTSFQDYLHAARLEARTARQREATPIQAPVPGAGLPVDVRAAFVENTAPNDVSPVEIRWRMLLEDEVYRIDVDDHALVLNARYRAAIVGRRALDRDDAPLVKSLLLLLLSDHFLGTGAGARRKREDAAWQSVLLAAVRAQTDD